MTNQETQEFLQAIKGSFFSKAKTKELTFSLSEKDEIEITPYEPFVFGKLEIALLQLIVDKAEATNLLSSKPIITDNRIEAEVASLLNINGRGTHLKLSKKDLLSTLDLEDSEKSLDAIQNAFENFLSVSICVEAKTTDDKKIFMSDRLITGLGIIKSEEEYTVNLSVFGVVASILLEAYKL